MAKEFKPSPQLRVKNFLDKVVFWGCLILILPVFLAIVVFISWLESSGVLDALIGIGFIIMIIICLAFFLFCIAIVFGVLMTIWRVGIALALNVSLDAADDFLTTTGPGCIFTLINLAISIATVILFFHYGPTM